MAFFPNLHSSEGKSQIKYQIFNNLIVNLGKIRLPKVELLKFDGHMIPNKDERQKSVQLVDIILQYRNSPSVFWLHAYRQRRGHYLFEINFEPPWPWVLSDVFNSLSIKRSFSCCYAQHWATRPQFTAGNKE